MKVVIVGILLTLGLDGQHLQKNCRKLGRSNDRADAFILVTQAGYSVQLYISRAPGEDLV